jgi:hypothetical protein
MIHARIAHLLQEYLTTQLQIHYASLLDRSIDRGLRGERTPETTKTKTACPVPQIDSLFQGKYYYATKLQTKIKAHRLDHGSVPLFSIDRAVPERIHASLRPNSGLRLPSILLASPAAAATPASQVQVARAPARGSGDGMLVYIEGEVGEELFSPRLMGKRTADMHSTTD